MQACVSDQVNDISGVDALALDPAITGMDNKASSAAKEARFRVPVESLNEGDHIISYYLCKRAVDLLTASNKPYIALTLADQTGAIEARDWGHKLDKYPGIAAGEIVKIQSTVEMWEGRPQLKIEQMRAAVPENGYTKRDFMRRSAREPSEMLEELRQVVAMVANGEQLPDETTPTAVIAVSNVLDTLEQQLLDAPAAMQNHHAYIGGLLEHTLSLAHKALWCADQYNLDPVVMLGIAVFHDIGKVWELDWERQEFTRPGRMFGHITLGYEIVRDTYDTLALTEQDERQRDAILHGILSHHGSLEFGSPVVPCTKEAIAFHQLDMLDSRMNMFDEAVRNDSGAGEFTAWNKHFGGALKK